MITGEKRISHTHTQSNDWAEAFCFDTKHLAGGVVKADLRGQVPGGMWSLLQTKMEWEIQTDSNDFWRILWNYSPAHAVVNFRGSDRADRLVGEVTITGGMCIGRSEVLRSLRLYLWAWSQDHPHHWSPGGMRCKMKHRMVFLDWEWKKGSYQIILTLELF